ncbi:MAG: hypothetical protein OEV66_03305 [Spirochaetia bacterium]|nr:hypothetical protein [Spirochaetia bacterium]
MTDPNPCYCDTASCSACCGLHNIRYTHAEKKIWLESNTREFSKIDLKNRSMVLKFRETGEKALREKMIRPDVYICPFLGITDPKNLKTGCLLHESGSPHSQIKMVSHPQSFSFYGESICKSYNCLAKQDFSQPRINVIRFTRGDSLTYAKITANHNLQKVLYRLRILYPEFFENIFAVIVETLALNEIPVTSFEMPLTLDFFSDEELWYVLGMLFTEKGYYFDAFQIMEEGALLGKQTRKKMGI